MLKIQAENKRLSLNYDGQDLDRGELEERKSDLISKLSRESDPNKRYELEVELTSINSALKAIISSHEAIAETKAEIQRIDRERRSEEARIANQGRTAFEENCRLIATAAYTRFTNEHAPMFDMSQSEQWGRKLLPYYKTIFQELSYEGAAQQADEILTAPLQKREWKEVVKLPRPNARPARLEAV